MLKDRALIWRACTKKQMDHMESHYGRVTSSDLGWDLASSPLGVHREVMSPPSGDWFPPLSREAWVYRWSSKELNSWDF